MDESVLFALGLFKALALVAACLLETFCFVSMLFNFILRQIKFILQIFDSPLHIPASLRQLRLIPQLALAHFSLRIRLRLMHNAQELLLLQRNALPLKLHHL